MTSKRRHEGYLVIDNRNSPGVPAELVRKTGLPVEAGQGLFERGTITCSHCQAVVIINPLRTRERAYCSKCDHYICDVCGKRMEVTRECRPFKQVLDELQEAAARSEQAGITPSTILKT